MATKWIHLGVDGNVAAAIEELAGERAITKTEFVRQAVVDQIGRLRRCGEKRGSGSDGDGAADNPTRKT